MDICIFFRRVCSLMYAQNILHSFTSVRRENFTAKQKTGLYHLVIFPTKVSKRSLSSNLQLLHTWKQILTNESNKRCFIYSFCKLWFPSSTRLGPAVFIIGFIIKLKGIRWCVQTVLHMMHVKLGHNSPMSLSTLKTTEKERGKVSAFAR